jgi:hypothetical protein
MKRNLLLASALTGLCVLLSFLTLAVSGCSSVARALDIQNPRYTFRNIRPNIRFALPLSASTLDLDFTLGVENPNGVGLRMDRVDFDLLIDDTPVLTSMSRDPRVSIPANGYGDVHLATRIGYESLRTMARSVFDAVQGNRARYALRGTAYYDTPVGQLRFPVTVYSTGNR